MLGLKQIGNTEDASTEIWAADGLAEIGSLSRGRTSAKLVAPPMGRMFDLAEGL